MTNELDLYDLVQVVMAHDEETKDFKGALGVIININEGHEYPYELLFVGNKRLNEKSKKLGDILWKKYQLEAV